MKRETKQKCANLYRTYLTMHTVKQAVSSNNKIYYLARLIIPRLLK